MQGRKRLPFNSAGQSRAAGARFRTLPTPPAWMTAGAKERFAEVCEQLDAVGALAETDRGLVERYATVFDRWRAAEAALAASGDDLHYARLTNRAGQPASAVALPALAQANKAHDQLCKLESMLGLCPTERSRLPATRDAGPPDDVELLFARAGAKHE